MIMMILRRVLGAIGVCLLLTVVLFVLQQMSSTDPVRATVGPNASAEVIAAARAKLGLDQPLFLQWWHYVQGIPAGDLQVSLRTRQPVMSDLATFLPASVELALFAGLLAAVLALALGIATAGRWRGSSFFNTLLLGSASIPVFLLALLGVLLFYRTLGWLPAVGRTSLFDVPQGPTGLLTVDGLLAGRPDVTLDALRHLILPGACLALAPAVAIGRVLRSSLTTAMESDMAKTALSKGLSRSQVLLRHGLRNAATTPLSMAGLQLGALLAGLVIVETVFAWPGIGLYLQQSIPTSDFPAIAGTTLLLAVGYVAVNTLVDILQAVLDPRIAR